MNYDQPAQPIGIETGEQIRLANEKARQALRSRKYASDAKPTDETYSALERAFTHFSKELFGGTLPRCLISLQRRKGTYGFFEARKWDNAKGELADEIALNPQHLGEGSLEEGLSTLAHELCHLWQHHHGQPGRGQYHNREWAEKMKEIGLYPSSTGEPGGKETGDRMHHYIVPDSPFTKACQKLIGRGFELPWKERLPQKEATEEEGGEEELPPEAKSGRRVKYTCPAEEHLNAWAKPGVTSLMCADHQAQLIPAE